MRRGRITSDQYRAAERYAADYHRATSGNVRTSHSTSTGSDFSPWSRGDRRAEASISFSAAASMLAGSGGMYRHILDRVVIDEVPANRAAVEWSNGAPSRRLAPRAGIGVLRQALDMLVEHYKAEEADHA